VTAPPKAAAPTVDDTPLPSFETLIEREEEPTEKAPISYREFVYAVPYGTAESLIRSCFSELVEELAGAPAGKLVNLAVFDVVFTGKPPKPPLVTLTWK